MGRIRKLFDKYFCSPPRCIFCGDEKCTADFPVCKSCYENYKARSSEGCADCGAAPIDCNCVSVRHCAQYYRLFNYEHRSVCLMVIKLKRKINRFAFRFFASRLVAMIEAKTLGTLSFDCVTFVPRDIKGRRLHGFDQGEELAKCIGKLLGVPAVSFLLNNGQGGEQKRLSRNFRGIAAMARFEVNGKKLVGGKIPYKKVLLVDDIVTTGASMGECARILKDHGVKLVIGASVAHTPVRGRTVF